MICPICGSQNIDTHIHRRIKCGWCGMSIHFTPDNYPDPWKEENFKDFYIMKLARRVEKLSPLRKEA